MVNEENAILRFVSLLNTNNRIRFQALIDANDY